MELEIIAVYTIIDDLLISIGHHTDPQARMSDAEVMTTVIAAAAYYGGNHKNACCMLKENGYIPNMLGHSRYNRRLHRISYLFETLFAFLAGNS
ncbi:hypothetical protein F4X73_10100 [Candidatus Poribacteria bacterium]|nr:hypothetical protein [Candidatus Poribacteria bacterium]